MKPLALKGYSDWERIMHLYKSSLKGCNTLQLVLICRLLPVHLWILLPLLVHVAYLCWAQWQFSTKFHSSPPIHIGSCAPLIAFMTGRNSAGADPYHWILVAKNLYPEFLPSRKHHCQGKKYGKPHLGIFAYWAAAKGTSASLTILGWVSWHPTCALYIYYSHRNASRKKSQGPGDIKKSRRKIQKSGNCKREDFNWGSISHPHIKCCTCWQISSAQWTRAMFSFTSTCHYHHTFLTTHACVSFQLHYKVSKECL